MPNQAEPRAHLDSGNRGWRIVWRSAFAIARRTGPVLSVLVRLGVPSYHGEIATLSLVGRRTGKPRPASVAMIRLDDRRYVGTPNGTAAWIVNLAAMDMVMLTIGGEPTLSVRRCPSGLKVCAPSFTDSSRCGRGLGGSTVLWTPTVGEARGREPMSELTLADARRVTAAAEGKALELGCAVTITVTDAGGHVRAQARLEGARFGTLNVSTNKAFTAAAFGAPTKILAGLTQPGQDLFGFADAAGGRIAIFPGGMPLVREEEIVGAIGISGGSVDQDQDIADAGVAAL